MCQGHDEPREHAPCHWTPSGAIFHPFGGEGRGAVRAPMCPLTQCMTPLHHVPRTRRTKGARPLSLDPKPGHIPSIRGGGRGAVQAPMCPLTPCMTPLHHVPRTRRTKGACPLSVHHLMHTYALPPLDFFLPLPVPRPFLGGGTGADTGLSSCVSGKYAASVVGENPG